ncbi:hypothetical protein C7271_00375 [filamentous cyanobacterium CCP5]|nr:hypothetical protein C7271_00375 [filamentous cyanobacterium CCP5]
MSDRAKGRCEYGLIHQNFSIYTHEVDHIIAQKHGGQTTADNLVLSCLSYNRHKGTDLATYDPGHWRDYFPFQPSQSILGRALCPKQWTQWPYRGNYGNG